MNPLNVDVLVIGSGPAGLAVACQARRTGARRVIVLERNAEPGGILPQCIHNGFGLRVFEQDLTGPEYAQRWLQRALDAGAEVMTRTMVTRFGADRRITANGNGRLIDIIPQAVVLATGCRERPRGALNIPGTRPAGIYTAGTAQRLVNIEGYMPGRRFVILGSGDIGMIMARRVTLEGGQVLAMAEILPYVSGLKRNLVQCVHDFAIPLHTCTTVSEIRGQERVEAVVLSNVDTHWRPIRGTEREIACDTLLLSAGLIPEIELARMAGISLDPITGGVVVDERQATNLPGVYAAGNMVHVYDLVDDVSESALRAGQYAAQDVLGVKVNPTRAIPVAAGENVHHVVPQHLKPDPYQPAESVLEFRIRQPMEEPVTAQVLADGEVLLSKKLRYARPSEMISLTIPAEQTERLLNTAQLLVQVTATHRKA